MHPHLGRILTNIIITLLILNSLALLILKPGEASYYIAVINLGMLFIFLFFVFFEVRREAKASFLKKR
ncbi:MAG: hypothetical protein DRH17_12325 [Deltaproteobacteria bacterium]|nr:MAG: hypothetical protein DRH17_12325 [Deltaproteobacteria bacterium]